VRTKSCGDDGKRGSDFGRMFTLGFDIPEREMPNQNLCTYYVLFDHKKKPHLSREMLMMLYLKVMAV